MNRMTSPRSSLNFLLATVCIYGGFALACIGGGDSNGDDNNVMNNGTTENNSSNNTNAMTVFGERELEGNFDKGLTLGPNGPAPHYVVEGNITIESGELVIQPGTVIEFQSSKQLIVGENAIAKIGGEGDPVQLIGSIKQAGHWKGVSVNSVSNENVIDNTIISHAGSDNWSQAKYEPAALLIEGRTTLTHSTISDNEGNGMYAGEDADITGFASNTFTTNSLASMTLDVSRVSELDEGTSFDSKIRIGGELESEATWPNVTDYYEVTDRITVVAALTMNAGVVLKFEADTTFFVDENGALTTQGTATEPVKFVGSVEAPGHWEGIEVTSKNASNALAHTIISHAGSTTQSEAGYEPVALSVNGGTIVISNTQFSDNKGYGIFANEEARLPGFSTNTFATNDLGSMLIDAGRGGELDAASTMDSNVFIEGEVNAEATWPALNVSYEVVGDIKLNASTTLSAGVSLAFQEDHAVLVEEQGVLIAQGTSDSTISFVGAVDSPTHWKGILISSQGDNVIDHVEFKHFGSKTWSAASYDPYALVVNKGALTISNTSFDDFDVAEANAVFVTDDSTLTDSGGNLVMGESTSFEVVAP